MGMNWIPKAKASAYYSCRKCWEGVRKCLKLVLSLAGARAPGALRSSFLLAS
jgi:hypothetical protein